MATSEELNARQAELRQRIVELEEVAAAGKRAQLEIGKLNEELLSTMKALRDLDDPLVKVSEFPAKPGDGTQIPDPKASPTFGQESSQSCSVSDSSPLASPSPMEETKADVCLESLDYSVPINLEKLQEMTKGADLLVLSRVYFSTADRALKEANQALINKDFRALKAVARELETQAISYSTPEMLKLSKELQMAATAQDGTSGKIFVEALKQALATVKSFVYSHQNA